MSSQKSSLNDTEGSSEDDIDIISTGKRLDELLKIL